MTRVKRVLIVDDDADFVGALAPLFETRGLEVATATTLESALNAVSQSNEVDFAVVDLNLKTGSGLRVVERLTECFPKCRTVVLTGYASIATSVDAIKLGATHYLSKPATFESIWEAFQHQPSLDFASDSDESGIAPSGLERAEWELIQDTLKRCDYNISKAARELGMHRRSLQRKLKKREYFN